MTEVKPFPLFIDHETMERINALRQKGGQGSNEEVVLSLILYALSSVENITKE